MSAEDMSEFYKAHLNARWRDHLDYNIEWQRRNFREGLVCQCSFWMNEHEITYQI